MLSKYTVVYSFILLSLVISNFGSYLGTTVEAHVGYGFGGGDSGGTVCSVERKEVGTAWGVGGLIKKEQRK